MSMFVSGCLRRSRSVGWRAPASRGQLGLSDRHFSTHLQGRATVEGTLAFVADSDLPLYHRFASSKLTINPIIHGAPRAYSYHENHTYIEALTRRAVVKNRSNCVVVYQHSETPWYSTNLEALFSDPANNVHRSQIVCMADLGRAADSAELLRRLSEACRVTGLDTIDIALVQLDEGVKTSVLQDSMEALRGLCQGGHLQSWGLQVSVAPYTYHSPPLKRSGPLSMLPMVLEQSVMSQDAYADLIIYPISPTSALPATYPMLDPDPALWDEGDESWERTRMFTRAALDPLVCRIGGKGGRYYEPKRVREERSRLEKEEAEEMAEAEAEEALEAGAGTVGAEGAEVGTEEAEGAEVGAGRDVEGTEVEAYDNLKVDSYNTYELSALELHLITGEQPEAVQQALGASLDALCPPLASSKTLQHKALRVVFSVGVDVCIIDAEASAKLGRLSLTSEDMLTSDETDQVFEHFYLPSHLDGESSPLS